MQYFLTFDVGTTSMKCLLFDENFKEVFFDETEYSLLTPAQDIVEIDPDIYFDTLCGSTNKIANLGINIDDIAAITITTQGETLIPINNAGKPLRNAIVWIDGRATAEAEEIRSRIASNEIYRTTGLGEINGCVPAAKLLWIYKNERNVYDNTYKFMLLEDYLIYRLTGKTVTEQSLISSTAWFDIVNECYYDKMLEVCSIDRDKLPEILPCGEKVAELTCDAAKQTGLSQKTIVVTGAMDQVSSAIGAGNICDGIVTETTGTALVAGATASQPDFSGDPAITIYKHFNHGYLYMPYCNTAGIVLKWFRDELMKELKREAKESGISSYALIDEIASESKAGSNGVVVLPHFAGRGVTTPNDKTKGVIYGITLGTKLSDIARSVLESVACMLKELVDSFEKQGINVTEIRSLGGGANSDLWCEIKSGICNKNIMRSSYAQTTALGAAILGATAIGRYTSVEEAVKMADLGFTKFEPKTEDLTAYKKVSEKYYELYDALDKVF